MQTRPILVLLGLLATVAVLADAYTWVDEEGLVHYSDRPEPGAKRIALPGDGQSTARTRSTPVRAAANRPAQPQPESQPFRYQSVAVSSPGPEETLWNIDSVLSVSVALMPGLQSGHLVRVYLDGGPAQIVSGPNFQLEEVFRGVHNIQVEVIDPTGKLMIRSVPNRFYVQQNTVNRGGP